MGWAPPICSRLDAAPAARLLVSRRLTEFYLSSASTNIYLSSLWKITEKFCITPCSKHKTVTFMVLLLHRRMVSRRLALFSRLTVNHASAMCFFLYVVYELLVGLAAATAQEQDPVIKAKIQQAQVWTVVSWCTYPVVYLFPMVGLGGCRSAPWLCISKLSTCMGLRVASLCISPDYSMRTFRS